MDPKEKAKLMRNLNAWLYEEKMQKEDLLKDLDAIMMATMEIRAENLDLQGNFEELTILSTKLIHKFGVSYPDRKKAQECVNWWFNSVLPRKDILEGFKNYFCGVFQHEFSNCIRNEFVDTRYFINKKIHKLIRSLVMICNVYLFCVSYQLYCIVLLIL